MSRKVTGTPENPTAIYRCCQRIAAMVMRIVFDQKSYGTQNVPRTGGVLVVSNHVSYADPCIVAAISPRQFAFLADSYLWGFKPFGWLISRLNAFPVKQGKGDVGAVKQTIGLLNDGWR
ncbi:MAG: lysophospholipid acyltransferase family protein [Tepidisphaeraceae bacterium]